MNAVVLQELRRVEVVEGGELQLKTKIYLKTS